MKIRSFGDKTFDVINYVFVTLFSLACLFPFLYVASFSVTPYAEYLENPMKLIPSQIELGAYKQILHMPLMWTGYRNTILITVIGVAINIVLMLISAYPLSKTDLKGRNVVLVLITFTMFFNGGLIPNFYLVKELHLYNTLWSMILPGALSAYNLILMKNFVGAIPPSLEEAAFIDGANELKVLWKIIVPLSKPAIATFVIFHAVAQWNTFFAAVMYTSKRDLWPLMLILRDLVVDDGGLAKDAMDASSAGVTVFTIKMAIIIFASLPILLVYPFLQRFFMQGLLVGSIKG
ncbi:putative aldouronate transport system permease protein [Paenibacillus sp. UNCCL117]|uniref:carbohydrate ABC transporter permease n=1 Tax=unclassified Paenibacillus TaxID=185978 RepID=UPI00088B166A|nr:MULTISPECIES: carbohydrate ABC transporter permease [unclassified Paenibacillus]SDC54953.1 putative aldouronate transport system permease protein [Paenibacillus sp. cl123]SFW10986.1 putative aldouronate transport system permease protein [Paenibacillus sp. UNCCL117]